MIKRETIDKIFETARVEEVIGDFVNLKRAGSNLKGYSPFNEEKSPSFMVSPVKQIWKDFSSGKGGNVVSFLMEHEQMTYPEALRWLAKRYNIEIEETEENQEEKQKRTERESLYIVLDFAKNWYQKQLLETETGKSVGLGYFKERGFRQEILKKFETGFAPNEKDAFTKEAIKQGYKLDYLIKAGLTIDRNGQQIDRFRGRVLFPIHSLSGRVIGFGGRILNTQLKTAKYINSPESDVYHKSKILYGIFQAKQEIVRNDQCILVEGYTDVLAFHQAQIKNTVASSGTALTTEQIHLIKRLTKNVLVIFDGDPAGIRAALRGIDMILEQGLNVKVLLLPDGEDPDSFSKKVSSDELLLYIEENAQDFIKFKASLFNEEASNDPIKKGELIKNIIESIAKIPSTIQHEIYIKEVSTLMGISEAVLFKELAIVQRNQMRQVEKAYQRKKQTESLKPVEKQEKKVELIDKRKVLERDIIKHLLLYGNRDVEIEEWEIKDIPTDNSEPLIEKSLKKTTVAQEIYLQLQEDELEFTNPVFSKIYDLITPILLSGEEFNVSKLQSDLDEQSSHVISDILMEGEKYKLDDWDKYEIEVKTADQTLSWSVSDNVLNLRKLLIEDLIKESNEKFKSEEVNPKELMEEIRDYIFLKKVISMRLRRLSV